MNDLVAEGLKWVGASVAALASIALFSMTPANDDLYPTVSEAHLPHRATSSSDPQPYPTDPNFLELREPRDPSRRFRRKREPRICYVESDEEPDDWAEERKSFNAHMLNQHGLKVCDYAFDKKLPPVPKLQLKRRKGPQPLKRARDEYESTAGAGPSNQGASSSHGDRDAKRHKLERKSTEPDLDSKDIPPSSLSGFGDLNKGPSNKGQGKLAPPSTPVAGPSNAMPTPPNTPPAVGSRAAVQPQGILASKSWIDTPPLTPSGTPATLDRASILASQQEMNVDEPAACPSTAARLSSSGAVQEQAPMSPRTPRPQRSLSRCSSVSSLSSLPSAPPTQRASSPMDSPRSSLRDISSSYNVPSPDPADAPRYALRSRANKEQSPTPSRGATPEKAEKLQPAGGRKTRSSAAKRAAGSPKAAYSPVRRSPRTRGKRPVRW